MLKFSQWCVESRNEFEFFISFVKMESTSYQDGYQDVSGVRFVCACLVRNIITHTHLALQLIPVGDFVIYSPKFRLITLLFISEEGA